MRVAWTGCDEVHCHIGREHNIRGTGFILFQLHHTLPTQGGKTVLNLQEGT